MDWLWAWANGHWPKDVTEDAARVRTFGSEFDIQELVMESVEDSDLDEIGWRMTAVTAHLADSVGAYRSTSSPGALFLVLRSIAFVS